MVRTGLHCRARARSKRNVNDTLGNQTGADRDVWDHAKVQGNLFVAAEKDALVSLGLGPLAKRAQARERVTTLMRKI